MFKLCRILVIPAVVVLVSGCGSRPEDRILSGAGIGAGAGALAGAATGGSVGAGALIGGVAGGVIGGTTKKKHINLGRPIWR